MNRPADEPASPLDRRRAEILELAARALARRRRRDLRRRRSAFAAAGLLAAGLAAWAIVPRPAPAPTRHAEALPEPPGIEIRLLSDDELIELLESAGYRVELIRTPEAVTVRIGAGPEPASGS